MLATWNKSCDKPKQHIKKQRHHFADKGSIVIAMVYPVIIFGCESCTIKKSEHQRIDTVDLWCWRKLLRVPWIARRSNQSILKETNPEYSLEGLIRKLQYFGHLMGRANSLEKTLILGKIEGRSRWEGQRMRWLDGITDSMDMSLKKLQEVEKDSKALHPVVHGVTKSQTWKSNWTTIWKHGLEVDSLTRFLPPLIYNSEAFNFILLWEIFSYFYG